jgi:hypothetical protein
MKKIYSVYFRKYDNSESTLVSYEDDVNKYNLRLTNKGVLLIEVSENETLAEKIQALELFGITKIILSQEVDIDYSIDILKKEIIEVEEIIDNG